MMVYNGQWLIMVNNIILVWLMMINQYNTVLISGSHTLQ